MTLLELSSNTEPEGNMDIVLLVVMCKKMLICVGILLQTLTILKPAYQVLVNLQALEINL